MAATSATSFPAALPNLLRFGLSRYRLCKGKHAKPKPIWMRDGLLNCRTVCQCSLATVPLLPRRCCTELVEKLFEQVESQDSQRSTFSAALLEASLVSVLMQKQFQHLRLSILSQRRASSEHLSFFSRKQVTVKSCEFFLPNSVNFGQNPKP